MVPPVIGFERRRAAGRGNRVQAPAGLREREPERGPGFGGCRVEPAGVAGMVDGAGKRRAVRLLIGTRRLESHQARIGQPDVRRCVLVGFARGPPFDRDTEAIAAPRHPSR
jgi:hypothetical protein